MVCEASQNQEGSCENNAMHDQNWIWPVGSPYLINKLRLGTLSSALVAAWKMKIVDIMTMVSA